MSLGNVAVGSTFSALQSAGAIGLAGTTKAAIVGAGGTVASEEWLLVRDAIAEF